MKKFTNRNRTGPRNAAIVTSLVSKFTAKPTRNPIPAKRKRKKKKSKTLVGDMGLII